MRLTDYVLHASLQTGHYGCVEVLVTWGADVDTDIPHLGTALYTACVCQELECARKLLREGGPATPCNSMQLHATPCNSMQVLAAPSCSLQLCTQIKESKHPPLKKRVYKNMSKV